MPNPWRWRSPKQLWIFEVHIKEPPAYNFHINLGKNY